MAWPLQGPGRAEAEPFWPLGPGGWLRWLRCSRPAPALPVRALCKALCLCPCRGAARCFAALRLQLAVQRRRPATVSVFRFESGRKVSVAQRKWRTRPCDLSRGAAGRLCALQGNANRSRPSRPHRANRQQAGRRSATRLSSAAFGCVRQRDEGISVPRAESGRCGRWLQPSAPPIFAPIFYLFPAADTVSRITSHARPTAVRPGQAWPGPARPGSVRLGPARSPQYESRVYFESESRAARICIAAAMPPPRRRARICFLGLSFARFAPGMRPCASPFLTVQPAARGARGPRFEPARPRRRFCFIA